MFPLLVSCYRHSKMNESVSLMWDETFDLIVMGHSITLAQHLYRTLVFTVGMFANNMVVMVTSISRQFLHQPRHIFWAAISLFEFIFIVNSVLESITVQYHDELACRFWIVLYPVDDSALMLCHFLATIDRYLSIVRYEWYKDKVTNRRVVGLISFAFVVSFVVITSPFWTGYSHLQLYHQFDSFADRSDVEFLVGTRLRPTPLQDILRN